VIGVEADAEALRIFTEHRGRLRAVAYRMLGRFADAEDVVQDAWLRWSGVTVAQIAEPEAFLVRMTTRLAMDRLRSARARRESYVGPWLPEPVLTSPDVADDVVRHDTVSTALLLVLEALSPVERAVFVLREAFGYSYADIGEMVGRTEPAVRQTMRRARDHVQDHHPRYDTDQDLRRRVTERFLAAASGGDLGGLLDILAPGVTLVSDGGGLAPAPRKAIHGAEVVARAMVTFAGRMPPEPTSEIVVLNGGPGIVVRSAGTPVVVLVLHLVDGVVETIHLVSNPEKLAGLRTGGPRTSELT
jgi:RNA polymerase sigma-70 factor (ECF subfamily)